MRSTRLPAMPSVCSAPMLMSTTPFGETVGVWLLGKQMAGGAVSCILSGVLSSGCWASRWLEVR